MRYFGIVVMITVMLVGTISLAEAHPHVSFDLMESHSHDINDEGFVEHFFINTFEQVIISLESFLKNLAVMSNF